MAGQPMSSLLVVKVLGKPRGQWDNVGDLPHVSGRAGLKEVESPRA